MHAPVSVLMSTYNRAQYIEQAITSILNQSLPPKQFIVVNDGSTDKTEAVLSRFADRITILDQANAGKSVALNRALKLVTEEFVWVFDDDDVAFPDALSRHMEVLARAPGDCFTYSPYYKAESAPDGSLIRGAPSPMPDTTPEQVFPKLLMSSFMPQQGSICPTRCFREVGGYREDFTRSLDYEFVLRLARRCPAVRVMNPTFYLRVHSGARGTSADSFKASDTALRWHQNDKIIFGNLYCDLALWEYLPHMPGSTPPAEFDHALAMLTRIGIMGRNGLWDEVMGDLEQFISRGLNQHVSIDEIGHHLETAFSTPLGVRDLVQYPNNLQKVIRLIHMIDSDYLNAICARKIYHAVIFEKRHREYTNIWRIIHAASGMIGFRGAIDIVRNKLANRPPIPKKMAAITRGNDKAAS